MTTTTPTPALADLDLLTDALRECANALAYAAFNIDGKTLDDLDPRLLESTGVSDSCLIAERAARSALAEAKQFALARRAAQPVAPVQDVLTIPTAIMDIACDHRLHDEYKRGHRDARHAAADLVLARTDELKALATPSPQIAEVAELSERQAFAAAMKEAWPGTVRAEDDEYWTGQYGHIWRSAIAASRRAAGGEVVAWRYRLRDKSNCVPDQWNFTTNPTWANRMGHAWHIEPLCLATPAPASAGQAAPVDAADILARLSKNGYACYLIGTGAEEVSRLAAQPAEGAGQAGQVANGRELSEVINFAIAGYKKGFAVEQIFGATPSDANGWMARFVMSAIEHYRPDVQNAAPTERAAAPAEQPSAQKGGEA